MKVKCPKCDAVFLYWSTEFRPFCSERCKMIDLGQWFDESYAVPGEHTEFDTEDE
ncbi:MAG: DNA gyrase inhibitor YacG [Bdellovibrionales bacterium]|nr:DNA gyrase inhibitor YacG [Bdellovibrionales bacterium]